MRLSTKSRYAVSAMLNLALNGINRPATLAELAEKQNISLSYLEQLFARLRDNGLVRGVRGPGGGYYLAGDADTITIDAIIHAVDGHDQNTAKLKADTRAQKRDLSSHAIWDQLSRQLHEFLSHITLNDLIQYAKMRDEEHDTGKRNECTVADVTKRAA